MTSLLAGMELVMRTSENRLMVLELSFSFDYAQKNTAGS